MWSSCSPWGCCFEGVLPYKTDGSFHMFWDTTQTTGTEKGKEVTIDIHIKAKEGLRKHNTGIQTTNLVHK